MRKITCRVLGFLVILALLGISPVQAYYLQNTGGNAAEVYNTAMITNPTVFHNYYGLGLTQRVGANMILCPVQVRTGNPVQAIYLRFQTGSSNGRITRIDVRDGMALVRTFTPPTATAWSGSTKVLTLPLNVTRPFANGVTIVPYISQSSAPGAFYFFGCGAGTLYTA